MQSSDTTSNLSFTQFTYSGSGTQTVTVSFTEGTSNGFPASSGSSGSVLYYNVAADPATTFDGYSTCQVQIASSVVGATRTISGGNLSFTLTPGWGNWVDADPGWNGDFTPQRAVATISPFHRVKLSFSDGESGKR